MNFQENTHMISIYHPDRCSGVNKGGYWGYLPPPLESWGHKHPRLVT